MSTEVEAWDRYGRDELERVLNHYKAHENMARRSVVLLRLALVLLVLTVINAVLAVWLVWLRFAT